jgi:hypothetical protein
MGSVYLFKWTAVSADVKRKVTEMKKFFIFFLVLAMTAGILAACQSAASGGEKGETGDSTAGSETAGSPEGNQNDGTSANELSFEEISDADTLPAEIAGNIERLGKTRGYAYFKLDDAFIVSVNSGERNTGGYSIKVKTVENVGGVTRVTVEETAPGKDDMVTQALTYPSTIIKLKGTAGNFKVVGSEGEAFDLLTEGGKAEKIDAEGVYSGQIDNNSIEIYVDGEPGAFRINDSFTPVVGLLKKDDRVGISYFTNEHGQQILTRLEKLN